MKRLLCAFLLLVPVALMAGHNRYGSRHGVSISIDDDQEITRCDQIEVRFAGERVMMQEQNIPADSLRSLKVTNEQNGGMHVVGWDQNRYSVTACKAAGFDANVSDIKIALSGNELTASGPDGNDWVVYFLVRAPRNATLDLSTHNGGIDLHKVNGDVEARAKNGPVSVKNSSGKMDISTQNGPISLAGGSGDVKLRAQNGPLSVKLAGDSWLGGQLDASTKNGPLSVRIPRSYRSGVLVESAGHGPFACRAQACRDAKNTWLDTDDEDDDSDDDDHGHWRNRPRKVELGSGTQLVHLSTVNGPVSVKEVD